MTIRKPLVLEGIVVAQALCLPHRHSCWRLWSREDKGSRRVSTRQTKARGAILTVAAAEVCRGIAQKHRLPYHGAVTTEQRIDRLEQNVGRLAAVQDQMMDLLGLSLEGERRLATRVERMEEAHAKLEASVQRISETLQETNERLNGLIGVVDGFIRGRQP